VPLSGTPVGIGVNCKLEPPLVCVRAFVEFHKVHLSSAELGAGVDSSQPDKDPNGNDTDKEAEKKGRLHYAKSSRRICGFNALCRS
jgi:hypothetical protein